jgi:hypothetical protein
LLIDIFSKKCGEQISEQKEQRAYQSEACSYKKIQRALGMKFMRMKFTFPLIFSLVLVDLK